MLNYVGKCLFIEEGKGKQKEQAIVLGDIHLGYENEGKHAAGAVISQQLERDLYSSLDEVFDKVGKVNLIILLGDLKHGFSRMGEQERHALVNLFDYLEKKGKRIVVLKGNHDNYLENITSGRKIEVKEYFIWHEYCFVHGDQEFEEMHEKNVKYWIMGHLHPAISIREGIKVERYKCFLIGVYKKKNVVILPSFISSHEGVDILSSKSNLAWEFNLQKFEVKVVGEGLEVLTFGKVSKLH